MTFEEMKAQIMERILQQQLVTATISQPRMKSNEVKRIKLKP
ncbi:SAM-dependent methyltransferase, partial [Lysinibacillus xylanilyticus]